MKWKTNIEIQKEQAVTFPCLSENVLHSANAGQTSLLAITVVVLFSVTTTACVEHVVDDVSQRQNSESTSDTEPFDGSESKEDRVSGPRMGDPTRSSELLLWRGYHHEWLRHVLGFRVPHRISQFDSYVRTVQKAGESAGGEFHFGQNTGVDGNFMKPRGYWRSVHAPGVGVLETQTRIAFTDDSDGREVPKASTRWVETVVFNLDRPEMGHGRWNNYTVVLRGVKLDITCDDRLQPQDEPCNSNGMWPYRFHIKVGNCEHKEQQLHCDLEARIARAWTPNQGGLPPIEVKPFNDKLSFDLVVFTTAIGGPDSSFHAQTARVQPVSGRLRDEEPHMLERTVQGLPGYVNGVMAVTEFGFELSAHRDEERYQNLGRYIGAWGFGLTDLSYDNQSGLMRYMQRSQVWVPDTVVDANVTYSIGATLLQFGQGSRLSDNGVAAGQICNQSNGAPFFSAWNRCGDADVGPERSEDVVTIPRL
jgi:hypothetical protein